MPNWCYAYLTVCVDNEDVKLLEAMCENGGICKTMNPIPKELADTQSPTRIISELDFQEQEKRNAEKIAESKDEDINRLFLEKGITKKRSDYLIEEYGYDNWYEWCNHNYGTKWGDCDFSYEILDTNDDDTTNIEIRWSTAWSPLWLDIVNEFILTILTSNDFSRGFTADYWWEEEQGFGEEYLWADRNIGLVQKLAWDIPQWSGDDYVDDAGDYYSYLEQDFENNFGVFEKGFYLSYSLHEFKFKENDGSLKKVD